MRCRGQPRRSESPPSTRFAPRRKIVDSAPRTLPYLTLPYLIFGRCERRCNLVYLVSTPAGLYGRVALLSSLGASVLDMVEIEEEENLSELSVTQLKKRMKERDIDASGCTEVMSSTCQHTGACLAAPTPHPQTP